jgi:hypothetical protein
VPSNVHPFSIKGEKTAPQWALKLNSAPAAAEIWNSKGRMANIKVDRK